MTVHGIVGTVKAVHAHDISVTVDGGPPNRYVTTPGEKVAVKFESDLRAEAVDAAKIQKVGDTVLVYYYGYGTDTTAVAIKDLGTETYTKLEGTVTAFDKKNRTMTLKDDSGKEVTAQLAEDLVVDTDMGVESGKKFAPHKGDHVRVTFLAGATPTVMFLREAL
jgi:ABC-type Na+ efflux pump permease subunit